jgi:hypothetical protein
MLNSISNPSKIDINLYMLNAFSNPSKLCRKQHQEKTSRKKTHGSYMWIAILEKSI